MTRSTLSLHDLAQRIDRQQAELAKLCQEYEARQAQLQKLMRRKEELQTQLRQVETELNGVGRGSAVSPDPAATTPAMPAKPAGDKPGKKPTGSVSLLQLLLRIVAKAGRPITIKELATEVVRRKHPTTGRSIPALVGERVKYLVKKGLLRRRRIDRACCRLRRQRPRKFRRRSPRAARQRPSRRGRSLPGPQPPPRPPPLENRSGRCHSWAF